MMTPATPAQRMTGRTRVSLHPALPSPAAGLPGVALLDDAAALKARMAKAGPRDVVAGMFFQSAHEELTRKQGPRAAAQASRLALGEEHKDFEPRANYPVVDLLKLMDLGARLAGGDYASNLEDFGRAAMKAFLDSPMGRTLLVLGGKDPHRLLLALTSGRNSPAALGAPACERTGPNSVVIRYSAGLLGPSWLVGAISQAFHGIIGQKPQLAVTAGARPGMFELSVRW